MATLAARVFGDIQRQDLARRETRVLVALSGGGDSVALLLVLRSLHERGRVVVAGAAHLNHQLRGAASARDEAFCHELCARLALPLIVERVDAAAAARREKRSLEDAARRARYAFFERAADAVGADVIATGHTRDDQAETFLLRILRGAGTRGLGGIRPRNGRVIRPLLHVTRAELRAFLAASDERFCDDATNADVAVARNRVRHELLPLLASRFSPGIVAVLAREAELARRDEDYLHQQAIDLARRIVLSENDSEIRVAAPPLAAAHPALGSRAAQMLLARFARRDVGFDHVDGVLALADRPSGGAMALPGQEAIRAGDELILRRAARRAKEAVNSFAFSLSIPGEVRSAGWAIAAVEVADRSRLPRWEGRGTEVGIQAGRLALPLVVRNRRPGDRFRPLGAPGTRKLQDFLVDRKVPRSTRDVLPLVVDSRDRIVWVPGQAVAEEFKVSESPQAVILLTMRGLGLYGE